MKANFVKPVIAIELSTNGEGGGLNSSNLRLINSALKNKYNFVTFTYDSEYGRFISLKRINDISNQLRVINPDIVHFSGLQIMGLNIILACKLARIKNTLITVHGFTSDAIYYNKYKKIIVSYIFEPLTLLLSQNFYGVSRFVANRKILKLFNRKNLGYVYNLPFNSNYTFHGKSLRSEFAIESNVKIALTVSRITKDKGLHILEKAILEFSTFKDILFVIVGEGDYIDEMKLSLSDMIKNKQVLFLGYRSDIHDILKDGNIFVLPTLHETLSIALLEASLAGLPLIASRTGGIPEIVINEYNGLLVSPGCPRALFDGIYSLYMDNEKCNYLGSNAREYVKNKFNQDKIVDQIDSIYQKILNN